MCSCLTSRELRTCASSAASMLVLLGACSLPRRDAGLALDQLPLSSLAARQKKLPCPAESTESSQLAATSLPLDGDIATMEQGEGRSRICARDCYRQGVHGEGVHR